MNALVRKEIRLLLPSWSAALVLAIVPAWLIPVGGWVDWQHSPGVVVCYAFALASMLPSIALFGQEFGAGTFSILLAQPIDRRRLWRLKVGVLALALAGLLFAQSLSLALRLVGTVARPPSFWQIPIICGLLGFAQCSGALWSTLLFRQMAAAFWLTILAPVLFVLGTLLLVERFVPLPEIYGFIALGCYAVVGCLWARSLFLRGQDTQWTGGTLVLPAWLQFGGNQRLPVRDRARNPVRALIRKEFRSHAITLVFAAVLLVLHLSVTAIRSAASQGHHSNSMLYEASGLAWLLWFGLALMVGSSSISEERKQGTLESQLCLPVTCRGQFLVKLCVALFLGILLAGFMPIFVEGLAAQMGFPTELPGWQAPGLLTRLGWCCGFAAAVVLVSFYASSLSRNVLQTWGAAVVAGSGFTGFVFWAAEESYGGLSSLFMSDPGVILWRGPLVFWMAGPTLVFLVLGLAFHNFKRLQIGWDLWIRNLVVLLGPLALVVMTTILVWNRSWELALNLEPRHGPAQLRGPVEPKICSDGDMPLVLLPDGRIWAATTFRPMTLKGPGSDPNESYLPVTVPTSGRFLESSNWIDLAGASREAAGIRSDGSLWRIGGAWRVDRIKKDGGNSDLRFPPLKIARFGEDANWKRVVEGGGSFLGLKQDGTLWGWGMNEHGQLGPGPKSIVIRPVRVGVDSGWAAIYASGGTVIGVKRDGSVWKWGYLPSLPEVLFTKSSHSSEPKFWQIDHSEPVRWNLNGADWRAYCSGVRTDFFVKNDGSLWCSGYLPYSLFGTVLNPGNAPGNIYYSTPRRVGHDSWSSASDRYEVVVGLKSSGKLVESDLFIPQLWAGDNAWHPSKYADWIAVRSAFDFAIQALASDGTLSCWDPVSSQIYYNRLLGPTHRPLWSVNIFEISK